ncbi:biotin transporter BioY [Edaphobacter sp.]|uniref:biotin transporter BioY n=1 Tax=Edaphobacter sp. TaxID=1934404 RepID=UPI002DB97D9A|nr:biotin transporter BioY [Edaphobacter sp.]HEU5340108.1 biotin transporter BioY [Edaphobacter sp.]
MHFLFLISAACFCALVYAAAGIVRHIQADISPSATHEKGPRTMHSTLSQTSLAQRTESFTQSLPGKATLAVAATVFVAACAHISFPLPFTPVPLTLQTFAVILVGLALGPVVGFSALALYLLEGAAGMPVFSPHGPGGIAQLVGPTGGYLFSYPLAAAVAGWAVRSLPQMSRFTRAAVAGLAATVIIFALGAGWMAYLGHLTAIAVWTLAIVPFLPGEAVKIAAASGIYSAFQRAKRS